MDQIEISPIQKIKKPNNGNSKQDLQFNSCIGIENFGGIGNYSWIISGQVLSQGFCLGNTFYVNADMRIYRGTIVFGFANPILTGFAEYELFSGILTADGNGIDVLWPSQDAHAFQDFPGTYIFPLSLFVDPYSDCSRDYKLFATLVSIKGGETGLQQLCDFCMDIPLN